MNDDPFVHLAWGWRLCLHDNGWFVIDGRSIERVRGRWPTWRTFNYGMADPTFPLRFRSVRVLRHHARRMMMDKEMMRALESDGEKLRQLTGEDHGPWDPDDLWWCEVCGTDTQPGHLVCDQCNSKDGLE